MKTTEKIAKELGVTLQAIEKRLNPEFTRQFKDHMEEREGNVYFDAEVEEFLRLLFNKSEKQEANVRTWYEEAFDGLANPAGREVQAAREEAALAKPPALLPAVHFSQLPVVRAITMPLDYQPELLAQAVEVQRGELFEFLNQFDRLVDYLAPEDWQRGRMGRMGHAPRKPIRLVGTTGR
jgi:hypothetical protein